MKATRSRLAKRRALSDVLRAVPVAEAAIATSYLSGALRQRRTGLGARSLSALPQPAGEATLTLTEVDATFGALAELSGPGSQGRRTVSLDVLMSRATEDEQRYLAGLISGELRQGALDALVVESLAEAVGAPVGDVRRAVMLAGSTSVVAEAVLRDGTGALSRFTLRLGTPVRPMLASSSSSVSEALRTGVRRCWMPSSTAFASRCTRMAATWASSHGRWRTSRIASLTWSRSLLTYPWSERCSMVRPCCWGAMGVHARSRSPPRGSRVAATPRRCQCSSSTCCNATTNTSVWHCPSSFCRSRSSSFFRSSN